MAASSNASAIRDAVCPTHGTFEAHQLFRDHWSTCPTCAEQERERAEREAKAARHAEIVANAMNQSGLVGRFANATFSNFAATTKEQRHAVMACQDFAAAATRGTWATLVLVGPPGVGKTHLAAGVVHAQIHQRGLWARYTTFRDLIRQLRATWRRGAEETEEAVIKDLAGAPLLVVDEIGTGMGTEAELVQFFDVIDRRYQLANPLVLVSNLAVPDLRLALGDRLADRIRENSTVVPCNWPSHRGLKQ